MNPIRRIILCADDYAIAPGVSAAIRTLLSKGRLNATSVMTVTPEFAAEAAALAATAMPLRASIGLHVTLTGPFKPLRASPLVTADRNFPHLSQYVMLDARFRVSRAAVEDEIAAQIEAFGGAFGRAPDYVDSHQHIHLMPGIRTAFLQVVARAAPKAWVRQCAPAHWWRLWAVDGKSLILGWLSLGFRWHARRRGLASNPAFAGAYDFSTGEDFGSLFARFLRHLPDGGLVMCHPGFVDEILRARDPLTERRQAEYAFLAGDGLPLALQRARVTLA